MVLVACVTERLLAGTKIKEVVQWHQLAQLK
jgi:hypothetical protein